MSARGTSDALLLTKVERPDMKKKSFFTGLKCRECGRHYPKEALHVCEFCFGPLEVAYDYDAIKSASPSKIESIDMGRRGLHDEGAEMLRGKLSEHVVVDDSTARRLFTLICVLHVRGRSRSWCGAGVRDGDGA